MAEDSLAQHDVAPKWRQACIRTRFMDKLRDFGRKKERRYVGFSIIFPRAK